jgi:hypothetical protein
VKRDDPEAVREPLDRYVDAVQALAGRRRASSRPSRHVLIARRRRRGRYRGAIYPSPIVLRAARAICVGDLNRRRPADGEHSPHREPIIPGCAARVDKAAAMQRDRLQCRRLGGQRSRDSRYFLGSAPPVERDT